MISVCSDIIPSHVHCVIRFLSAALYKHEFIFTKAKQNTIEQGIELLLRLHLYDCTIEQKQCTSHRLEPSLKLLEDSIHAIIQFEETLHHDFWTRKGSQSHTVLNERRKQYKKNINQSWNHTLEDLKNLKHIKRRPHNRKRRSRA